MRNSKQFLLPRSPAAGRRRWVGCVAAAMSMVGFGLVFAATTNASPSHHIHPAHGAATCHDLGFAGDLTVDPFAAGAYSDSSGLTVRISGVQQANDYVTFDWSSNGPIEAVIVREDGDALTYSYDGAFGDSQVAAPGLHPDSVSFCHHHRSAVSLRSFTVSHLKAGNQLSWRVASEVDVVGYNLYRGSQRLNRSLIPAVAGLSGHTYRWLDRAHVSGRYRLQARNLNGSSSWYRAS